MPAPRSAHPLLSWPTIAAIRSQILRSPSLFAFAAITLAAPPLSAVTITSNTIISAENSFPGEAVVIADGEAPPTVVQMIDGGEAQRIFMAGSSILNFQGGRVTDYIYASGTSTVNIRGGEMGSFSVGRGSAIGNVFGGTIRGQVDVSTAFGSATLNVFGGELGSVGGSAGITPFEIHIHGGHMNWISVYSATPSSVLNITGGTFDGFSPSGRMTVEWSGGEPRIWGYSVLWDESTLNVYGRNLVLHEEFSSNYLSGTLLDGTVLDEFFISRATNAQIILHNVPEPSTLALGIVASSLLMLVRRSRRRRTVGNAPSNRHHIGRKPAPSTTSARIACPPRNARLHFLTLPQFRWNTPTYRSKSRPWRSPPRPPSTSSTPTA